MIKRLFILGFTLCFATLMSAQDNLSALMPMPNNIVSGKGTYLTLSNRTNIVCADKTLSFAASELHRILHERMNLNVSVTGRSTGKGSIRLMLDSSLKGMEHYRLKVGSEGITIAGRSAAAVLYGVMTFDQLLMGDNYHSSHCQIASVSIDDSPRFARRELMLDPARHFLPIKDVKFYIDQMVKYKFNVLQLHLTDDQGWRIEIKGREKLTETGPFYTQAELKELVDYAAERAVEIVPELDIPGHTVAFLHAYPELGCTSNDTVPKVVGTTTNMMVCASVLEVYTVYKDIITQVAALFPSSYIHLGGDEAAVSKNWALCDRCKMTMKMNGFTKPEQLMILFFDKMLKYVREAGKTAILWCELDNIYPPANDYLFPYPKDVQLVSWRNGLTPTTINLTRKHGNQVLLAPGEYAYFDYPQLKGDLPEFNNWGMPVTTLRKCYEFDPGYGLPEAEQAHIVGVMGTLWGEAIVDINRACYMTFPRAFALSEAGWTEMNNRSWKSFKARIYPNLTELMKKGVSVRAPFEIAGVGD